MSYQKISDGIPKGKWFVFLSEPQKWISVGFVSENGLMQLAPEDDPTHYFEIPDPSQFLEDKKDENL